MKFIQFSFLAFTFIMCSCVSTKKNSRVSAITNAFEAINKNPKYSVESLMEAQSIVLEFYTLFNTGGLTASSLDKMTAKISPENGSILKDALGVINKETVSSKKKDKKIQKVKIPENIGQPSFSKMKNKLKFLLSDYNFNEEIIIPDKFEFNGTSIPEIAQEWLGNPFDKQLEVPGLVHDYLYSNKARHLDYNKESADLAFYHLLKKNNIPESKALVMYMGVVIGGHFFYQKD